MPRLSRPIRLLAEVLLIVGLTEVAVMWAMPLLVPSLEPLQESLLDVLLLLVLAAPPVYWRCMVLFRTPSAAPSRGAENKAGQFSFQRAVALTVIVQILGLLITAGGVLYLHNDLQTEAAAVFGHETDRLEDEINRRFQQVGYGLGGLRAHLAAAQVAHAAVPLPRAVFAAHVTARSLEAEFPGVRGMGFVERVPREAIAAYERRMQADGAPQYRVRSSGLAPDALVIRNIEPLINNGAALGFDIGQEPVRRASAERAISSGEASLTGKIALVQDSGQTPGFLLFLPVYREGQAPYLLPDLRPATLVGLLYAPIVASELLKTTRTVTQTHLNFALYDGNDLSAERRVFDDRLDPIAHTDGDDGHRFTQRILRVGGRLLTLQTHTTPAFDALQDRSRLALAGIGGAVLSLLAALATWLLAAGRLRAHNLARTMTHDLERLARVVQHTHNAVAITDANGVIEWVNAGFTRILGYSAESVRGRVILSFTAPDATDIMVRQALLREVQSGQAGRTELRIRTADDQLVWLDTEMQPIVNELGAVTGLMAIASDITLQKNAQLEKEAALREAATLLATFEAHAIVSITDRQGTITEVNDAFCAISGYRRDELLGANHRIVNSGAQPRAFWESVWAELASGKAWRGDICNRAKDGHLYWVDTIIAPFQGEDGLVERYVSIRNDITHRYAQAQALQNAVERAEQANLAKGQFVANMSHEIRTPMNAILGMLKLLQHTELTTQQQDYTGKSYKAAQSLLGLLNDILDFSKIEAGKMTLDPQPLRVDKLLRDLGAILSVNVHHKNVDLLYDIDPALAACVLCDGLRLQQVLINLCGNAIKFTEHGQVVVAVRVLAQRAGALQLEFAVTDSGIGIAPESQARIFDGFSQAEASTTRKFGGTGLGLSISRRLVALMGGTLALRSTLGKGTTFSFTVEFPLVADDSPEAPAARSGPLHALVVDDNPVARDLLQRMVQAWGWQVDTAASAAEALQRLQAEGARMDVVYTDCTMPDMDGWELIERLQAHCLQSGAHYPMVVMLSTQGREQLAQRPASEQALLHAYLVKPVTASMLLDATVAPHRGAALRTSVRGPSGQRRLRGMRLLVVEDNLINQQVAEELLSSEGALVALAANGQLGVEAVAAAQPQFDAVLMDLQMPVMDGYTATRTIRSVLGLAHLPIIAMTANALDSDRQECLQAGMSEHVGKPFDLDQLVRTLLQTTGYQPPASPSASAVLPTAAQAPTPALPEVAGLDVAGALARLGGMVPLYLRSVRDFRQALPAVMPQLRHSVRNDRALAAMQVHTLKGNAGTLGASALATSAAALEQMLKSGAADADALAPVLDHLEGLIAQTLAALAQLSSPQEDRAAAPVWHAVVRQLAELLAQEDYGCLDVFARERTVLDSLPAPARESLEQALQDLEFAEAHRICTELLAGTAAPQGTPG